MNSDDVLSKAMERIIEDRGCWIWTGSFNVHGAPVLDLRCNRRIASFFYVRRFLYEYLRDKKLDGKFVFSKCHPACVNPDHAVINETRGRNIPTSKETVILIRKLKRDGMGIREIYNHLNRTVNYFTIKGIFHNTVFKKWVF